VVVRAVMWDSAGGSLRSGLKKRIALVAVGAVAIAACSSCTSTSTPRATPGDPFNPVNFHPSWLAANVNATGAPVYGGTLKIEGNFDVTAFLDPQGEYETVGYTVERAFTRQLVSYPASTNLVTAETIVPDAATGMPTVSTDGRTYTFKIKSGVMWNTPTPRQVTSQDFKRGIERNCDPTLAPAGNPGYYTATIKGFKSFCTTFEGMDTASSAAARAAYINGHDASGIQTTDGSTIVFTLTQPATDFLNILALPFASAAPVEDLSDVPLTPGNPVYSDGPYQVLKYDVGHEIDLDHNPEWRQSTDTIRHDYVSNIDIKVDMPGSSAPEGVQADLITRAADLEWNTIVPLDDIGALTSPAWNPQYGVFPEPGSINPYLVFNVQSPNNSRALANVKVRRALEYAIDKVAINTSSGGSALNEPLNQVIGPGAEGYVPFNDYPTPGNKGDPEKCKTLLQHAGVTNLTLKDMYVANEVTSIAIFQDVQSDLGKCGVTVKGVASGYPDFYGSKGIGVTSANDLKSGKWDITSSTGWAPDWFGPANGRATLPDLFDGALSFPGTDFGGYDNRAVDALVAKAESDTTLKQAASDWHQADELVMADAAFIPFQANLTRIFRSAQVHNAIYFPPASSTTSPRSGFPNRPLDAACPTSAIAPAVR
jgi:ABC-type transport system substrate-binding protein